MRIRRPVAALVAVTGLLVGHMLYDQWTSPPPPEPVAYSELLRLARDGELASATLRGSNAEAVTRSGRAVTTHVPNDPWLVGDLVKAGIRVEAEAEDNRSPLVKGIAQWAPALLLAAVMIWAVRASRGGGAGGGNPFGTGRSRARVSRPGESTITFADVAGCDEAKEDVQELVTFLREPQRFARVGGRVPKGVLLAGPPGTGKTLLAKAVAGEAGVPFFSISGSDFVEMYVGVGASRVRSLFADARKHAPCIVFIDEIDAVGRRRSAGPGQGNDERESTLNQMLVEMDGFEPQSGIIVMAATNRIDILDPALVRPGRFDRHVNVGLPDVRGRAGILNVHMRNVPIGTDVRPEVIARGTPGFSGAELENLVNEAALSAARADRRTVSMQDFELAKEKLLMGPERRSVLIPERERRITAYHEAGHAIVARLLPETTDPVHKVSIVPRGRALGVTLQLPTDDRYSMDRERLESQIAMLAAGRVAEELFIGTVTTGASNDFERATTLARNMVVRWAMSDKVGPMVVADDGDGGVRPADLSERSRREIDEEVRTILATQLGRAREMLTEHAAVAHAMAEALLEHETIDAEQVDDLMARRPMRVRRDGGLPPAGGTPVAGQAAGDDADGLAAPAASPVRVPVH